jgi:glycine/D-amino acid oxidase-like deaminating enzyme
MAEAQSSHAEPHSASTTAAALASQAVPSLGTTSVWAAEAGARPSLYPQLQGEQATVYDVCVVGGGMVGVSTAYECAQAGMKVALLEARQFGRNTTGWSAEQTSATTMLRTQSLIVGIFSCCALDRSTAKLTAQQNLLYTTLASMHGKQTASLYGRMNLEAIDTVEELNMKLGLDCGFKRQAHATWTSSASVEPNVRKEAELCQEIGLPAVYLTGEQVAQDLPASIEPKGAVMFHGQAAFNPVKFCVGLAVRDATSNAMHICFSSSV